jgi:hypothetical protein
MKARDPEVSFIDYAELVKGMLFTMLFTFIALLTAYQFRRCL